jgi:hypothetical protein
MSNNIKISVPTPCHENWGNMTPESRGRFCAACQKTVVDFTNASDREIVTAYNKETNLCGRFRASQLDRELVITKEKNSLWAGAAAAAALLALSSTEAIAQTPVPTEQHEILGKMRIPDTTKQTLYGTVYNEQNQPLYDATVTLNGNPATSIITNLDGQFTLQATPGDIITLSIPGYLNENKVVAKDIFSYSFTMSIDPEATEELIVVGYAPRRTFFGRILHSIGSIFR